MFDVFGFWGIVTLITVPLPLLLGHAYLCRLYGLMFDSGVTPSSSSILYKAKFKTPTGLLAIVAIMSVLQTMFLVGCGTYTLVKGVSMVHTIASIAEALAPVGGVISAIAVIGLGIVFMEKLFVKVCMLMAKVDKLSSK